MDDQKIMKRQVAYKVSVNQILRGEYKKPEDGPNYMLVDNSLKISRVNIMGIVIESANASDSGYGSLIVDDSTGKISLRIFDINFL